MDRASLIRKFGEVKPWLVDRINAMSDHSWRLFYDQLEDGKPMPATFDDTMPRNREGFITNPFSSPPEYQQTEIEQWDEWSEIWGAKPWETIQPVKPRRVRGWRD